MIERYTLPLEPRATSDLLQPWRWLVPASYEIALLTKFGDWFLSAPSGRIQFLDLLDGTLTDLCAVADFVPDDPEFVSTYRNQLSVDWIEVCYQRGLTLQANQCFGWKLHPMLGGKLEFLNIQVFTLSIYESLLGQIFRQRNACPQGLKVTGFTLRSKDES